MGLHCSHDAFTGTYSAFNSLRQCVAHAIVDRDGYRGSYPPHIKFYDNDSPIIDDNYCYVIRDDMDRKLWYWTDEQSSEKDPGLQFFFNHDDYKGSIPPTMCKKVANELEALIPEIERMNWENYSHILYYDGYVKALEKFIAGCRLAHSKRQSLKFR